MLAMKLALERQRSCFILFQHFIPKMLKIDFHRHIFHHRIIRNSLRHLRCGGNDNVVRIFMKINIKRVCHMTKIANS